MVLTAFAGTMLSSDWSSRVELTGNANVWNFQTPNFARPMPFAQGAKELKLPSAKRLAKLDFMGARPPPPLITAPRATEAPKSVAPSPKDTKSESSTDFSGAPTDTIADVVAARPPPPLIAAPRATEAPKSAAPSPKGTKSESSTDFSGAPTDAIADMKSVPTSRSAIQSATSAEATLESPEPGSSGGAKQSASAPKEDITLNLLSKRGDVHPDKVLVQMFMEAECPNCKRYTNTYMSHILSAKGVGDIVDFEWVPWGRSKTMEKVFSVQAGPDPVYVVNKTDALESLIDRMHDTVLHGPPQVSFICEHGEQGTLHNAHENIGHPKLRLDLHRVRG